MLASRQPWPAPSQPVNRLSVERSASASKGLANSAPSTVAKALASSVRLIGYIVGVVPCSTSHSL